MRRAQGAVHAANERVVKSDGWSEVAELRAGIVRWFDPEPGGVEDLLECAGDLLSGIVVGALQDPYQFAKHGRVHDQRLTALGGAFDLRGRPGVLAGVVAGQVAHQHVGVEADDRHASASA